MATPKTSANYDTSYRRLFAEREMVIDLLRSPWVQEELTAMIDLDAPLEPLGLAHPLPPEQSAGEQVKEGDVAYRIPCKPGMEARHTFVMLEFQSSIHPRMDVRMLVYAGLIWLQAGRADPPEWALEESPYTAPDPVLPIVLYNGSRRWTRPTTLRSRVPIGSSGALRKLQPDMSFVLIDIGRLNIPDNVEQLKTPTALLFALERWDPRRPLTPLVERISVVLRGARFEGLREAFASFIIDLACSRGVTITRGEINHIRGLGAMFAERITEMREEDRRVNSEAMVAAFMKLQGEALTEDDMNRLGAHISSQALTPAMIKATSREAVLQWAKGTPSSDTPAPSLRKKS